ncbi:MAG: permease [Bacillota bacterium]
MKLPRASRYCLFLAVLAVDLGILAFRPEVGWAILRTTAQNFYQMARFLPPVFLVLGFLDVWVPRATVVAALGQRSGLNGMLLAFFLGFAAAGPLYAAFPIASVMLAKGASFFNVLVFLGAWSTLKLPMTLYELSALGPRFALTRWGLNAIGIVAMAAFITRLFSGREMENLYRRQPAVQAARPGNPARR